MGRSNRRVLTTVIAAAVISTVLAACSSSGGSSNGGGASSPAGSTSSAAAGAGSSSAGASSASAGAGSSSAAASGASGAASLQSLYAQAKTEGKVVVWGGEDPGELQGAFNQFSKTYPGLKLQFTAVNPDQQAAHLAEAKAAGQPLPDIIQGRLEYMPTLTQAGFINQNPGWAKYSVPSSIISYNGGLIEYKSLYVLAYNKKLVTNTASLPSTWTALDNPQWKGKLSLDPRGFPFNVLAASMGESATVNYVKKLIADTKPAYVQGSTSGLTNLSAGAQALRPAALEDVKTALAKGAPLAYVVPSPALVQDTLWYLTAGAKDNAAAMLFAIWFTSAQGGEPIMTKQDNRNNQLPAAAQGKTVISYETPAQAAVVATATPAVSKLLGGS